MPKAIVCLCLVILCAAAASSAQPPAGYTAVIVPMPQRTNFYGQPNGSKVVDLNSKGDILAVECNPGIYWDPASCTAVLSSIKSGNFQELFQTCPIGTCAGNVGDLMIRLNERGDVGGYIPQGVVVWSAQKGLRVLGQVQLIAGHPPITGIDDQDEVAGYAQTYPPGPSKAYFATEQTGIYFLPADFCVPYALSAAGEIVGQAVGGAFYWSRKAGMIDIGALFAGSWSIATSIDRNGIVLGTIAGPSPALFLWERTHGLLAQAPLPSSCEPLASTSKNEVIGICQQTYSGPTSVWTWTADQGFRDRGTLGYNVSAIANGAGQIAGGRRDTPTGTGHAYIWSMDTGLVDLDSRTSSVTALSEDGVAGGLLGDGTLGHAQAVVWVPQKH
jgi:hypothetical protein